MGAFSELAAAGEWSKKIADHYINILEEGSPLGSIDISGLSDMALTYVGLMANAYQNKQGGTVSPQQGCIWAELQRAEISARFISVRRNIIADQLG